MDRFLKPPTDASAYPKEKTNDPIYRNKNYAGNEETVKKFLDLATIHATYFLGQGQRQKQEYERLKSADAMYRMAKDQTKQDENLTPGTTDTIPHIFFTSVRMITSNECDAMFHDGQLPMKFVPMENLSESQLAEARIVAEKQNLTLEYSFVTDKREPKVKESVEMCNKYANELIGMEWYYNEEQYRERTAIKNPVTGESTLKWRTVNEIKEHPSFFRIDIKDVLFDDLVDDIQQQQCIVIRRRPLLHELRKGQMKGHYINLDKLNNGFHLYTGESPSWVLADRQNNAGETVDAYNSTGAYDEKVIWLRAPINEQGEWDEEGTFATWHIGRILGQLGDPNALCLELKKNPYDGFEIPYKLVHSHRDDKGAFHMGYEDLIRPVWNEYKTTLDQWFHAKNLNGNAPWMQEEGAILNSDKSFGPNRLYIVRRGMIDKVRHLDVRVNTQDMQAFIGYLEAKSDHIMATEKAYRGEAMGGRTSAGEAKSVIEQSMKPAIEKMRYLSDQYFEWMAEWDRKMWRQFGDPDHVVAILNGPEPEEVKPAWLEGPLRVKIQCVDRFEDNTVGRMEFDRMLQMTLPSVMSMGAKTVGRLIRYAYKRHKVPVEEIFPSMSDADARHVQWAENLGFINGQWSEPKESEDHETHQAIVASGRSLYKSSWPEPDKNVLGMFDQHELMHKQLAEREQVQARQGAMMQQQQNQNQGQQQEQPIGQQEIPAGMGSAETAPVTEGQAMQNMLGATEGGIA